VTNAAPLDNALDPPPSHRSSGVVDPTGVAGSRRVRALEQFMASQVEPDVQEVVEVGFPISDRTIRIRKPTEVWLERQVEAWRLDREKPMPYWARIWPAGIALGDVVLQRRDELAGQRVLELGSGLGTTATALLEAGARLTVVDYSPLPLAFCRYNTLMNTGRAPRTLCFNWSAPNAESLLRAQAHGGYPIIMAADVLYEGRDVEPLLAILDHILAPDGVLWLSERSRRTAQRFLYTAAALGWQGDTRQIAGPWPDGNPATVNVHFLRRPAHLDRILSNLGGWRTT